MEAVVIFQRQIDSPPPSLSRITEKNQLLVYEILKWNWCDDGYFEIWINNNLKLPETVDPMYTQLFRLLKCEDPAFESTTPEIINHSNYYHHYYANIFFYGWKNTPVFRFVSMENTLNLNELKSWIIFIFHFWLIKLFIRSEKTSSSRHLNQSKYFNLLSVCRLFVCFFFSFSFGFDGMRFAMLCLAWIRKQKNLFHQFALATFHAFNIQHPIQIYNINRHTCSGCPWWCFTYLSFAFLSFRGYF